MNLHTNLFMIYGGGIVNESCPMYALFIYQSFMSLRNNLFIIHCGGIVAESRPIHFVFIHIFVEYLCVSICFLFTAAEYLTSPT